MKLFYWRDSVGTRSSLDYSPSVSFGREQAPKARLAAHSAIDRLICQSIRCNKHRERHLDELLVPIDGFQGSSNVVGDFGRAVGFDRVGKLKDGCFKGELVFVNLE